MKNQDVQSGAQAFQPNGKKKIQKIKNLIIYHCITHFIYKKHTKNKYILQPAYGNAINYFLLKFERN